MAALPSPPLDCVSRVRFSPQRGSPILLVSSWDSCVRLYDTSKSQLMGLQKQGMALMDCAFLDDTTCISGGLEKRVVAYNFQGQQEVEIGRHDAAIRCIEYHQPTGMVISGSWDRSIRMWDPRGPPGTPIQYSNLGVKVFCMDVGVHDLIVGGSDRCIYMYDVRKLGEPRQKRASSLKYQVRALKVSLDQKSYVAGSIEGRVALEYFDEEENQRSRYAFKCHREKGDKGEIVHPVNAVSIHPVFGTFASGGSDGVVCIWDGYAKKRLNRTNPHNTTISSLSFSADGTRLATGISYTFDDGEKLPLPSSSVQVRNIEESEVLPKKSRD